MVIDSMKECGIETKNWELIGDTIFDAQWAPKSGITFFDVIWRYNNSDILAQNGASTVFFPTPKKSRRYYAINWLKLSGKSQ